MTLELGTININSGYMYVTDPCYDTDVWCCNKIKVKPGKWVVTELGSDTSRDRGDCLQVVHEDYVNRKYYHERANFSVGVDSGTVSFADSKFYEEKHKDEATKEEWWQNDVCAELIIQDNEKHTCYTDTYKRDEMVARSTKWGDGDYPCYIGKNEQGEIVACFIEHGTSEDEEVDYEYDDDIDYDEEVELEEEY